MRRDSPWIVDPRALAHLTFILTMGPLIGWLMGLAAVALLG